MEPLSLIYLIKICLGAFAAVLCVLLSLFGFDIVMTASTAILIYLISDKLLRQIFIEKVEKPAVVTKTGVGIYFITWVFVWITLYTLVLYLTSSLPA